MNLELLTEKTLEINKLWTCFSINKVKKMNNTHTYLVHKNNQQRYFFPGSASQKLSILNVLMRS